jgi:four helix bundle protein
MAVYKRFEDVPVWQEAARLYHSVLDFLLIPSLAVSVGFRNQLDRAGLSVSNNIAEGFERMSTKELVSFLAIARGSAGEVRSMVRVIALRDSMKVHLNPIKEIDQLPENCGKQIGGWVRALEEAPIQGKRYVGLQNSNRKIDKGSAIP